MKACGRMVCVDHGFGHWSKGMTKACGKGSNEGDIIPSRTVQGMLDFNDPFMSDNRNELCVRVSKHTCPMGHHEG
jgi:hypothetical protein